MWGEHSAASSRVGSRVENGAGRGAGTGVETGEEMRDRGRGWQGQVRLAAAGALTLASLVACSDPAETALNLVRNGDGRDTVATLGALYADSIFVEGTVERIQVRDYQTPLGYPLGFRTVLPSDMAVGYHNSGRGDAVRFEAVFGGIRRPDVALEFTVLPNGMDEGEAIERVANLAIELDAIPRETNSGDFAQARYALGGEEIGFIALGEHEGHWYVFVARYPPEFGDGMGPRIDLILRRWRWAADGAQLIAE